ncbi:unnamed protein product, partial [Lota lota]
GSAAGDPGPAAPDCGQCWMLLVILCPSSALLLSLFSSLVVYLHCRKIGPRCERGSSRAETELNSSSFFGCMCV